MVCKIIEQFDSKKDLAAALQSRDASALACTNTDHAHLIRSLKRVAKEQYDRHMQLAALHAKKQAEQEQEDHLLRLAFCM